MDSKKRGEHAQTFNVYLGLYLQNVGRREDEIAGQQRRLVERGQTTNKKISILGYSAPIHTLSMRVDSPGLRAHTRVECAWISGVDIAQHG